MTYPDTAAIRAAYSVEDEWTLSRERVLELCDALDDAALRVALLSAALHGQLARAEEAEAKVDELRADLSRARKARTW